MKELTLTADNKLQEKYRDIFLSHAEDYSSLGELVNAIYRGEFNCSSGCIGELIYYYQTDGIFTDHFNDVLEMVKEYEINYELNANSLIWVTFEYMVNNVWCFEIEDYIDQDKQFKALTYRQYAKAII